MFFHSILTAYSLRKTCYNGFHMQQYYIFGLGNQGEAYERTRHNAGAIAAERFFARYDGAGAVAVHSNEYMNHSGRAAARAVLPKDVARLIVVHDDIDVPLGTVRVAFGRGDGGHNGVRSIIEHLGTKDFIRVRIGVAKKNIFGTLRKPKGEKAVHEFLLAEMKPRDEEALMRVIDEKVLPALTLIVTEGKEHAMRMCNTHAGFSS